MIGRTMFGFLFLVALVFTAPQVRKSQECEECDFLVQMLHKAWGENTTEQCVGEAAYFICTTLRIEDNFVCNAVVNEFLPELDYILGQVIFEPHQLCGLLVKDCGTFYDPLIAPWHVPMPPNQPTPVQKQAVPAGRPILKVLHLSDIHVDTQYVVGSEVMCGEPQCCRPINDTQELSFSANIKQPAGKWGSVGNCDVPYWTFTNMLQFIQKNHKDLDYVVVSGDLESHAIWDYQKDAHAAMVKNISDTIRAYMGNTPVYFAVGNHEAVPIDNFAPHFAPKEYQMHWLYDTMADSWKGWVPDDQMSIVKYRACYMVQLYDGLRLLSINNPLGGDSINFWMLMNQTDPDGTLQWIMDQLTIAEAVGDKVHIVAHIPGGDGEALEGWAINYYNVINRFQNTIVAQFFGHTHSDQFYVAYSNATDQFSTPTHVVYSAPSVTTYSDYFPSYRIYNVDGNYRGSTYQVIDYEEWFLNLTIANANPSQTPQWQQFFASINKELGLQAQLPSEWNNLITRMHNDDTLFQKYYSIRARRNSYDGLDKCEGRCKKNLLCTLRQFHHDKKLCSDLNIEEDYEPQPRMYQKKNKKTQASPHVLRNENCKL